MSAILDKPFSWVKCISRAIFKGSPNLITTSDLNRQITALKAELHALQTSLGAVISDFDVKRTDETETIYASCSGTYVFCKGMRFEISMTQKFAIPKGVSFISLYAKKKLVTSEGDFSKEISGAKFADGTTQPAADHYVYYEPVIKFESADSRTPLSSSDLGFTDDTEVEQRICDLARVYRYDGSDDNVSRIPGGDVCIQKYSIFGPMMDIPVVRGNFDLYDSVTKENCYLDKVPAPNDNWQAVAKKLWDRVYTMEKRFYGETQDYMDESANTNAGTYSVNGKQYTRRRKCKGENTGFEVYMSYYIVGNMCFLNGICKNTNQYNTTSLQDFSLTSLEGDVEGFPIPLSGALYGTVFPVFKVSPFTNAPDESNALAGSGRILDNKMSLKFSGQLTVGDYYAFNTCYPISSKGMWKPCIEDVNPFFEDYK